MRWRRRSAIGKGSIMSAASSSVARTCPRARLKYRCGVSPRSRGFSGTEGGATSTSPSSRPRDTAISSNRCRFALCRSSMSASCRRLVSCSTSSIASTRRSATNAAPLLGRSATAVSSSSSIIASACLAADASICSSSLISLSSSGKNCSSVFSQMRTLRSLEPDTTKLPETDTDRAHTSAWWPGNVMRHSCLSPSQYLTSLSLPAEKK
mmetsp:Transcript_32895/g.77135  ORF Transcript_32895/g.77135 Transcript_32895/m.77135 type:complete len:209 (+) Transcript_32895:417-1043(+)